MAQLIKTINGLPIASVKTINGLPIALVKSVNGLDNTSAGGSYPGFTYDVLQDFESPLSGDWSKSDGDDSIDEQDAAAKWRGTYGASVVSGIATERYVLWDKAGADYSSITFGFFYKSGEYGNFEDGRWLCRVRNDGLGGIFRIMEGKPGGGGSSPRINWNLSGDSVDVANNTWYFIKARFTRLGTCEVAVFDALTAVQVGTTMTATDTTDVSVNDIWFGSFGVASITATYFDDIFIRYAGTTNTLLPFPTGS